MTKDEQHRTITRLRRINEIQKQAMDRWCPCSDHRDKTPPKYCPVCENEKLRKRLDTVSIAARRVVSMSWPPSRPRIQDLREVLNWSKTKEK